MKDMKRFFFLLFAPLVVGGVMALMAGSCNRPEPEPEPEPDPTPLTDFAKGADVSWLTQMEHDGCKFYTPAGKEMECMELLKTLGVNSIRLRVWVNPEGGWCGKEDVVAKAKRAKALGMRIMIDFHYSDSWADPGKQNKPAAWKDLSFSALREAMVEHTTDVLTALRDAGVTPEWIQIGNETIGGMLWPDGQNYNDVGFGRYVDLNNSGYAAAKEVFPFAKVLIHVDKGQDASQLNWFFNKCEQFGARYDMIGLSLYPDPGNMMQFRTQIINNIKNLYLAYEKDCIICELGMSWTEGTICNDLIAGLMASSLNEMEGHCQGIFYWEPEGYESWSHYSKAAFSNEGRPTNALYAFQN